MAKMSPAEIERISAHQANVVGLAIVENLEIGLGKNNALSTSGKTRNKAYTVEEAQEYAMLIVANLEARFTKQDLTKLDKALGERLVKEYAGPITAIANALVKEGQTAEEHEKAIDDALAALAVMSKQLTVFHNQQEFSATRAIIDFTMGQHPGESRADEFAVSVSDFINVLLANKERFVGKKSFLTINGWQLDRPLRSGENKKQAIFSDYVGYLTEFIRHQQAIRDVAEAQKPSKPKVAATDV